MASKTGSISRGEAQKIWAEVRTPMWLQLLNHFAHDFQWKSVGGGRITGRCPYHEETSPGAFSILTDKGFAKCLSAKCQAFESDPVALFAQILGTSYEEALRQGFIEFLALSISPKIVAQIQKQHSDDILKEHVFLACRNTLLRALGSPGAPEFSYARPLIEWLARRKVNTALLGRLPFGMLPTRRHLDDQVQDADMRARVRAYINDRADKDERQDLLPAGPNDTNLWVGGLVTAFHREHNRICRLKCRSMSSEETKTTMLGTPEEQTGLFGMELYRGIWGTDTAKTVIVVEGEMDAVSWYQHQLEDSPVVSHPVVAGGGGGLPFLGFLRAHGVERVIVVPDYDAGGVGFARLASSRCNNLRFGVLDWEHSPLSDLRGTDPDEVFVKHHRGLDLHLATVGDGHVLDRTTWLYRGIEDDIAALGSTPDPESVYAVLERVQDAMATPQVREVVYSRLQEAGVVDKALLRSNIAARASDEEFLELIGSRLQELLLPVAFDNATVRVYSRDTGALFDVNLARKSDAVLAICQFALRKTCREWLDDTIGLPHWLTHKPADEGKRPQRKPVLEQSGKCDDFVFEVLRRLFLGVPELAALDTKGQGLHVVDRRKHKSDVTDNQRFMAFLVNGQNVYRAALSPGDHLTEWESLTAPVFERTLFLTEPRAWDPFLSLEALNAEPRDSIRGVFTRVFELLDAGWQFAPQPEHHRLTATALSLFVIYAGCSALFDTKSQIYINGLPQSGKSSFLMGILSGAQYPDVRLQYASRGWEDWSAAGIVQVHAGSTNLACVDEFENPEGANTSKKARESQQLLEFLRGNIQRGVEGVRGSAGGQAQTRHIDMPVAGAGIHPFTAEVDFSRWDVHKFGKQYGARPDPRRIILERVGEEGVRELARDISVVMRQRLPELLSNYHGVLADKHFQVGFPPGIEPRFVASLHPLLAILRAAGEDVRGFFTSYLAYKSALRAAYVAPEADKILDDLLHTAAIRLQSDITNQKRTLGSILASRDRREELNQTSCGVYYVRELDMVVIHCAQTLANLLQDSPRFRGLADAKGLRLRLEQNPVFLSNERMAELKLASIVKRYVGAGRVTYHDFVAAPLSAFDVGAAVEPLPRPEAELSEVMPM